MTSAPLPAGRLLGRGDEILGLVVDRDVGAELAAGVAFLRRAGRHDHAGAEILGELDRGGADARRAAMHEQGLARLEAAALEHVVPDREEGFRDRGGFRRRQDGRDRQRMSFDRDAVFRIAAADHQGRHLIAGLPTRRALAAGRDRAGDLEARNIGRALRRRVKSAALHHVRSIDARRRDLDQNFARPGYRHRALLGNQHLGSTGRADRDRGHGCGQGHGGSSS